VLSVRELGSVPTLVPPGGRGRRTRCPSETPGEPWQAGDGREGCVSPSRWARPRRSSCHGVRTDGHRGGRKTAGTGDGRGQGGPGHVACRGEPGPPRRRLRLRRAGRRAEVRPCRLGLSRHGHGPLGVRSRGESERQELHPAWRSAERTGRGLRVVRRLPAVCGLSRPRWGSPARAKPRVREWGRSRICHSHAPLSGGAALNERRRPARNRSGRGAAQTTWLTGRARPRTRPPPGSP
jgi:hypothetical protein